MNRAKTAKPLTKEQYLKKFSRAVRWRLPPQESEEAIADYRELVLEEERDESKLVEELGEPVQAAHLLTDVRTYRRWLAVFAVLAFELFLLAKWAWTGMPFVWFTWDYSAFGESWRSIVVLAAGLVLSLYWFRRHGQKSGPMPKWLLPALAAVLAFALVMMGLTWHQFGPKFLALFSEMNYETLMGTSLAWQITLYRELLIDGGTVCPFIALAGLILAKCYDRRWLALYTLALTAAALCLLVELHLLSMDVSILDLYEIRPFLFARLLPIGAAGLIGTGVALC